MRAIALVAVALALALVSAARGGETEVAPHAPGAAGAPPADVGAALSLELIPDAWPALPRVIAYEYNQKNHHDVPTFEGAGAEPPAPPPAGKRRRWRVIGIVVKNAGAAPFEGKLVLRSDRAPAEKVRAPARGESAHFFVVRDRTEEGGGEPVRADLLDAKDQVVASLARPLPPAARPTFNPTEARFVARELDREERVRLSYPAFPVLVRAVAEAGHPLAHARLTLHHEQFGLIHTAELDGEGRWSGSLLAGAWMAIAFGAATEEARGDETTVVRTPRTVYLLKQFDVGPAALAPGSGAVEVELRADQMARIRVRDEAGEPVETLRIAVAPHRIAEALRFADVARRCRDAFVLDIEARASQGAIDLLTNRGATYDFTAVARPAEGVTALLALAGSPGAGEIALVFSPARMARLIFDPPTGFGGGRAMAATVTLLGAGAARLAHALRATGLETVYVPPGKVRLDLAYGTRNGDALRFIPRRLDLKPGETYDATPRPLFSMTLFTKKDRGVQVWVALQDGAGQIVDRIEAGPAPAPDGGPPNALVAWRGQEKLFEQPLASMSFAFPTGLERIDLASVAMETRVRIGTERLRGQPAVEPVRRFQMHGTWAVAPRIVEDHVDAFLAMVAKSCEAEKKFLGGPPFPVGMDFQVFLPPGVGGLGGGGMIALELGELLRFTDETDALPYAFCHELGHNVGFGHDPYMLLAPCGVEEGTYGLLGYRMANGKELDAVFRYLGERRHRDRGTWTLSPHVFAGLRLLFGPEVHRKMFEAQRAFENALKAAGLSSIERIATQYSIALDQNVAWIFRAYGWPVFDQRVEWGRAAAATRGSDVQAFHADQAQVAAFRRWWVEGPIGEGAPAAANGGGAAEAGAGPGAEGGGLAQGGPDSVWQAVTWPTDFISLDMDRPASPLERRYRLFVRFAVPQNAIAFLVGTSDCALEVRLNGHAVARFDASPQLAQPVHDELMLDRKRAFPVLLLAGENTIEVDALQPPGARGFLLGLAGPDGRPIAARLRPEGPEGEDLAPEPKALKPVGPVLDPGFEEGAGQSFGPWTAGPIEGGLRAAIDDLEFAGGRRSLRIEAVRPGAGGIIQRVVVEPGAVYRVRAKIKTEKLDGEAYVSLFTGDIGNTISRTEPLRGPGLPPRWVEAGGRFASQKRRSVYVCCWVKAKSGTVWFDDVELVREK